MQNTNDTFVHILQRLAVLMSEKPYDDRELNDKTASQCDEELYTLQSVSKQLEQRIALVCRKRNTFASINSLPRELLADIFAIVIGIEWGTGSSDHGTLALVCHYWNQLVNTTPSLWTKIQRDSKTSAARILRALEKSQNAPLEITFAPWGVDEAGQNAFLDAIFPHTHRWKYVSLWLGEHARGLEAMPTSSLPLLEYLLLSVDEWSGWVTQQPLDLFGGRPPPRLRHLSLAGIPVQWSPTILCHLTVLSITRIRSLGPSLDQLLEVLASCPDMKFLCLSDVGFSGGIGASATSPVHMPALERLELRILTTEITNRILASIHAPNCTSGNLNCNVQGDPLKTLFTSDISHFLDHIRSNPSDGSITCSLGQFNISRMGQWFITLDIENITFAKDTLLWLSSTSPIQITINGLTTPPTDVLAAVADMEALYQINFGYDVPVSDALTLLATCSSAPGGTRWPFPALVGMSIESGVVGDDWEKLLLMLRRRQGVLETQDEAQRPKPLRSLGFGSDWYGGVDDPVIANFSSTYWPNRLDEVRRLLGAKGELIWYGKVVTEEGVLEDRVVSQN